MSNGHGVFTKEDFESSTYFLSFINKLSKQSYCLELYVAYDRENHEDDFVNDHVLSN